MKTIKVIVAAAFVAGVISASAFASSDALSTCPQVKFDRPTVTKTVDLTGLPYRFSGATVNVAFVLDVNGQPHDIKLLTQADPKIEKSVRTALAQWRFTPAQKDGTPIPVRVVMPLQLI